MKTFKTRKRKNAVSPVIATILLVAITVVLVAVLYIMVTQFMQNPGSVATPLGVNAKIVSSTNVTISVSSAPSNAILNGVVFTIEKQDGTPVAISGGAYYRAGATLSGVSFSGGRVSAPSTEVIKAGDTINLQASTTLQSGYKLKITPSSSGGFGVTETTLST